MRVKFLSAALLCAAAFVWAEEPEDLQAKIDGLNKEIAALKTDVTRLERENTRLKGSVSDLEKEPQKLKADILAKEQSNKAKDREIVDLKNKNTSIQKALDETRAKLEEAQADLEKGDNALINERDELSKKLAAAEGKISSLEEENETLSTEKSGLKNQIEALPSKSYVLLFGVIAGAAGLLLGGVLVWILHPKKGSHGQRGKTQPEPRRTYSDNNTARATEGYINRGGGSSFIKRDEEALGSGSGALRELNLGLRRSAPEQPQPRPVSALSSAPRAEPRPLSAPTLPPATPRAEQPPTPRAEPPPAPPAPDINSLFRSSGQRSGRTEPDVLIGLTTKALQEIAEGAKGTLLFERKTNKYTAEYVLVNGKDIYPNFYLYNETKNLPEGNAISRIYAIRGSLPGKIQACKPAAVEQTSEGWKLTAMGELTVS